MLIDPLDVQVTEVMVCLDSLLW